MDKLLTFQTSNDKGIFIYTVGEGRDQQYLEKTACAELHPEVANYVSQASKIPGKTQVLLTALGAGEYWGSNVNGDFFPEVALRNPTEQYGYKTFEKYAKVYKHHVNKDPKKSYGDVAISVWNDKMKRVELIVVIDDAKAPDLAERINNGEYPEVSMGCKVPYDVCSCCGNKAKTRAQYCDHLRYHMNKIPPGFTKRAYAINTLPRFFDISFVLIGADRIAAVMRKVAHAHPQHGISSAHIAEISSTEYIPGQEKVASAQPYKGESQVQSELRQGFEKIAFGLTKEKVAAKKVAEMEKQVPGNIKPEVIQKLEDVGKRGVEALRAHEPDIPKKTIIRMSFGPSGMGTLNKILSTLSILGIVPKKHEFQDIALRALGKPDLAENYASRGVLFDPETPLNPAQRCACEKHLDINARHFDGAVFDQVKPHMEDRSYARPLLEKRVNKLVKLAEEGKLEYPITKHVKTAQEERQPMNALPMMLTLAGLYAALGKKAPEVAKSGLDKILGKYPGLALAVGVGAVAGFGSLTQRNVMGKYDFNPDKGPVHDPNESWQERIHKLNKNPLTKTGGVATRLFLGVPAIYMASGLQTVKKIRDPNREESGVGSFIRKNPDVASALFVGEAMMGRPVSGRISKGLSMLRKTASFGEDLKSTAIFSLAFPGASLPLRAASTLVDYGIMAGVDKLLSKKDQSVRRGNNA